jgi:hypothetical protein
MLTENAHTFATIGRFTQTARWFASGVVAARQLLPGARGSEMSCAGGPFHNRSVLISQRDFIIQPRVARATLGQRSVESATLNGLHQRRIGTDGYNPVGVGNYSGSLTQGGRCASTLG